MNRQIVFLIGFMGAGKTTLGKKLATKLEVDFIDSDQAIEEENNQTITELFECLGEEEFRKREREWLREFNPITSTVVAVGGGMPCFHGNMELMNHKGITVYLNHSPQVLTDRLFESGTTRPLIAPFSENKKLLNAFITARLNERQQFYEKATYCLKEEQIELNELIEIARKV